ncbi:MAG: DUF1553 domain-containing protein, partial [Planctomycetes bacterium]|nr:DUF1553 domain-containing protein [Planctomycetota bacterium]
QAVKHVGELKMPPRGRLADEEIAAIERWIEMGAPDPRDGRGLSPKPHVDVEQGRKFWAFQPPTRIAPPRIKAENWPRGPIDRYILARLESKGLTPALDAARAVLLRRATHALIGLPPTPEEIDAFVHDGATDDEALARVVDRLLASPHFGERWGRHWLDVARFAESSGGGRSLLFKDAWRYRDYVIASFNHDKPFNQFVLEQIAGDLLDTRTPEQRRAFLIATAFLLLGPHNYERQDKPTLEMDIIDEQLDTIGKGFLGMTVGCARCHDHKFDPIPTKDYYALAGILKSTRFIIHDNVSKWTTQSLPMPAAQEVALRKHEAVLASLRERIREAKDGGRPVPMELQTQLRHLEKTGPVRPTAMAVAEGQHIGDIYVCVRGNVHSRGEKVRRGFLQAATNGPMPRLTDKESGRRELAHWIANPDNPLTVRVFVNRVWQHLFGAGIVRTVDNFGATGELPSHPELLDWLARRFIERGWSVKMLIREIMLSRAYRMSAEVGLDVQESAARLDPENRLLWKMNRRRLDAEALRDSILVASGTLDRRQGGPTIREGTTTERDYQFTDARRSIYTPVFRNRVLELFEVFDFANPNVATGRRNVSTVPTQALYLLNSPFVMEQSRLAAQRMVAASEPEVAKQISAVYRRTLGRLPTAREQQLTLEYLENAGRNEKQRLAAWDRFYQTLFACLDFRFIN